MCEWKLCYSWHNGISLLPLTVAAVAAAAATKWIELPTQVCLLHFRRVNARQVVWRLQNYSIPAVRFSFTKFSSAFLSLASLSLPSSSVLQLGPKSSPVIQPLRYTYHAFMHQIPQVQPTATQTKDSKSVIVWPAIAFCTVRRMSTPSHSVHSGLNDAYTR